MSARTRSQSLVERPDLSQSRRAECHVCAEHAPDFDYLVAIVGNRQIEIDRHRPDFFIRIFFRDDSAFHAGELAMRIKERFHRVEITGRHGQIIIEENQDFFGASVQLAARLCGSAQADKILVSDGVRELCMGKNLQFMNQGNKRLKGFDQPVRVYEVDWTQD